MFAATCARWLSVDRVEKWQNNQALISHTGFRGYNLGTRNQPALVTINVVNNAEGIHALQLAWPGQPAVREPCEALT